MSKGFKKMLPVIAAIAIPFAAPFVAGAIGVSSAIGTAAVGAGLGAAAGGATGGTQGAVLGAIGGGFGSYARAGQLAAGAGASAGGGTAAKAAGITRTAAKTAGGAASPASLGGRVMGAIQSAGGQIAQGLTDPNMWGRAAMYLASGGIAAATAQKDPQLARYAAELERISAANMEVRNAAFGIGQELATEARNISPVRTGEIQANEAMTRVLGASAENIRNLPTYAAGGRSAMEAQGRLAAAKAGATAFNTGFSTGQEQRRTGLATAYSGVPQLQALGGDAARLSLAQSEMQAGQQAGILSSLQYIATGQQPTGGTTASPRTTDKPPGLQVGTPPTVPPGSVKLSQPSAPPKERGII